MNVIYDTKHTKSLTVADLRNLPPGTVFSIPGFNNDQCEYLANPILMLLNSAWFESVGIQAVLLNHKPNSPNHWVLHNDTSPIVLLDATLKVKEKNK